MSELVCRAPGRSQVGNWSRSTQVSVKILVDKKAFVMLMNAVCGPDYMVRELLVIKDLNPGNNPIDILVSDYAASQARLEPQVKDPDT